MAYSSNNGGVAQDQLRSIVERIERLREEIDALNKDVSEVYKEARGNGFDVPTLKALVSERAKAAKDPMAFQEKEALLDLYRHALETGTRNATRVHVREAASLRTDKSVVSPSAPAEATVKGEADGTLPRTASANAGSASNLHVSTTVEPGFNSIPACSSPPEPGGDGVVSSRASSPTNSDDFDPVRDMPAHLRDRPWESTGT